MEIIVGVTMVLILILIIWIFCKNVTININLNRTYPPVEEVRIGDIYDEDGKIKEKDDNMPDWNEVIAEFNSIMLDEEDNNG